MTDDRLSYLLDLWAEYMRGELGGNGMPDGYGSRAHVGSSTASKAWDAMVNDIERWQAEAIDACIDDLPMNECAAVHSVKLASVWRLREPIDDVYLRAREGLKAGLKRRGVE